MTGLGGLRADAHACHAAAVAAVAPARLVASRLTRAAGALVLVGPDGRPVARHGGPVVIAAAGKAALAMASTAATVVEPAGRGGVAIVPHGHAGACAGGVAVHAAGHPIPDPDGVAATARLRARVAGADRDTLVLVLLSGGASALLVEPAAGVSLGDKQVVTARLLASSADIAAVNTVRRHCSGVKGGGLARAAAGAAGLWALVLSDVIGDDPATIASGPTVADPTTFADAEAVLVRHLAPGDVPASVRAHLASGRAGKVSETVKPGDPALARARTVIVGGNRDAVDAAAAAARARGYRVLMLAEPLAGDAAAAGRLVVARLRELSREGPVAIVGGGETTVRVVQGGRGGRCQQLALAAACALAGEPGVVLAAGTDGVDGPTAAAGACVDGETVARATARGLDPRRALVATDSHPVLAATGDLVTTGPTGTNVADVVVALRPAC